MNKEQFVKYDSIPKEKFALVQDKGNIHDLKFDTKPVGYLKDAFRRFCKNKASVAAAIIILLIVLFAAVTPLFSSYKMDFSVATYSNMLPKNKFLSKFGICTGQTERNMNDRAYAYILGIGVGAADTDGKGATWKEGLDNEYAAAKKVGEPYTMQDGRYTDASVDVYYEVGFRYMSVTQEEYDAILAWQEENDKQIIYPMVNTFNEFIYPLRSNDANYWFKTNAKGDPVDDNGRKIDVYKQELSPNYLLDAEGNPRFFQYEDLSMLKIRVLYYNYYIYSYNSEPYHLLGTDSQGYDILIRLASGVRLSLLLAVLVSAINLTIGTIYGAIEGYYGGIADLAMERIIDILSGIPFIIVATLFQLHLANKVGPIVSLLFAFVLTGWIGTASTVRTQFYRFKNQEYILAARTLGAKDMRLMFKHILPNSLGTIITSSVLVIPGVIFSESSLSYLGIVNVTGDAGTSLGTMLASAQPHLARFPHLIIPPAIMISLLMITFNLFGNGLRDAFNPSLRGTEG